MTVRGLTSPAKDILGHVVSDSYPVCDRRVSLRSHGRELATIASPDYGARIEIDFSTTGSRAANPLSGALDTVSWTRLSALLKG